MNGNQALCYTYGNYFGWLINATPNSCDCSWFTLKIAEEMPNYKCDHRSKKISKKG